MGLSKGTGVSWALAHAGCVGSPHKNGKNSAGGAGHPQVQALASSARTSAHRWGPG